MKEQTGFDVAIAGAGASGLAAAVTAAGAGARVLLMERMDRVGKKILATGNGRCNLTNLEISARHYHTRDRAALTEMLAQMPAQKTLSFLRGLGCCAVCRRMEKYILIAFRHRWCSIACLPPYGGGGASAPR